MNSPQTMRALYQQALGWLGRLNDATERATTYHQVLRYSTVYEHATQRVQRRWEKYTAARQGVVFHECWYSSEQCVELARLATSVAPIAGEIVEVGAWEGRSTIALAKAVEPRVLHVVDHWRGNSDEAPDHPSVALARDRDVFATFQSNMQAATSGNVQTWRMDWREWIADWGAQTIAFFHLDASHDYCSVYDCLSAILPLMASDGIICGDDYFHKPLRRAVRAVLGKKVKHGDRFWWIRR